MSNKMQKQDSKLGRIDSINLERPLVLYGAGIRGRRLLAMALEIRLTNVFVVDRNQEYHRNGVFGVDVLSPDKIPNIIRGTALFCITIADFDIANEVRKQLVEIDCVFESAQEVSYDSLCLKLYDLVYKKSNFNHVSVCEGEWNVIIGHYNGLGLGGIESWIKDLAGRLNEEGRYRIRIACCKSVEVSDHKLSDLFDVFIPDDLEQERDSVPLFKKILVYLKSKLPCIVITTHADIIAKAAVILKIHNPSQVKIIATIHGGTANTINRYMEYNEWTDRVIGCSEDIRNALIDKGVPRYKAYNMTCPFPCEKEIKRQYSLNKTEAMRLGWAGRIEEISNKTQKRLDLLLESLTYLQSKNILFRMEIAGDGPGVSELKKQILVRGLDSKVTLVGKLDSCEIGLFWKKQDICISSSDYEGRSLSILEAMGNGAVPVVTEVSGVGEDIESGWNGYIVPSGDYKAICEKIEFLGEHRELLAVMGRRAHDAVYPKSLLDDHVRFWEKQIRDCISSD